MAGKKGEDYDCPGSVSGHNTGGTTDGTCTWCHVKIERPGLRKRSGGYMTRVRVGLGWVRSDRLGPEGLCGDRGDHRPHLHDSASLGRFWCTADQSRREPWRSQRRQDRDVKDPGNGA